MRRLLLAAVLVLLPCPARAAEPPYQPGPDTLQARAWFQDARFGLFIHWGLYAVPGEGEAVMEKQRIPAAEYEKLAARFNPADYDPAAWVALAKTAGMKYLTVTAKHHDGFALWDSHVSDWNVAARTPYKKDVLKLLADECHKQGVKFFLSYSHLDWHHPDYYPLARTGRHAGRPVGGDFNRYLDDVDAQLAELFGGRYGPLAGVRFDGWDDQQLTEPGGDPRRARVDWRLRKTYDLVHRLQPGALIGNNHPGPPFAGEDFQVFGKDSLSAADDRQADLPRETCDTINDSWGYSRNDRRFKSAAELVHRLVRAASRDANLLLGVGPRPDGGIQPEFVERLSEVGRWLGKNGEAVYATRGGGLPAQPWGVATRAKAGDRVYLQHVLDARAEVRLPGAAGQFAQPRRLDGGKVSLVTDGADLVLLMAPEARDPIDTVVVVEPVKK